MKKTLNFLIALFLILNCNTVYTAQVNMNYHFKEILLAILIFTSILQIRAKKIRKIGKSQLTFLILSFIYLSIFLLIGTASENTRIDYIYLFLVLFPLLYFIYASSEDDGLMKGILKGMSNAMLMISIISLIFYFLGTILKVINPTGTITMSWGGTRVISSYYGMHFDIQRQEVLGNTIIRNTGVFTEAPMYSLVLTIAIAIELFFKPKSSRIRLIVFLLSILTTYSTTGIVLSVFLFICKFIFSNEKAKIVKYLKILVIPAVLLIGIYIIFIAMNSKKETSSYKTRMDDYRASFLAWKDEPIFGNGYKNDDSIIQYMSQSRISNTGLSNSLLVLLAQGGIYLFIYYLIPMVRGIIYGLRYKDKSIVILTITLIILFITTIFLYKPIVINFLAMGYALKIKTRNTASNNLILKDKDV